MNFSSMTSMSAAAASLAWRIVIIGVLATASAVAMADGDGTIVGIVTNSAKLPVAHATVTAIKVGGGGIRATVSGSDGVYSFPDLPPGEWSITSQAEGFPDTTVPQLDVVASKATRFDIVMNAQAGAAAGSATASTVAPPVRALATVDHPSSNVFDKALGLLFAPSVNNKSIVVAQASATAPAAAALPAPTVPEALQAPDPAAPGPDTVTPFGNDDDIGWLNGQGREKSPIFDTKFFTPEIRFDVDYLQDFNHPVDHTIDGSTEAFRSQEVQIEQVSFGGNFHWNNVQARFLSMFGLFSVTTPRNDASYAVGQWDLQGAYKYFSEANAGYHWDNVGHGLNVDAGIFVSYIGLFSYYNYDNWTYQPSFVSSNTPWFFNGIRIQYWPTQDLKIEPWIINGWQSYAMYNGHPGLGGQVLWIPNNNFKLVLNSYFLGQDNVHAIFQNCNGQYLNAPNLLQGYAPTAAECTNAPYINTAKIQRIHEDDSVLYRYYESHGENGSGISKAAFSLTWDVGCQYGGGVSCTRGPNKDNFIGVMGYNRTWFDHDLYAVTIGGGFMNNPGRYLALLPPINGAVAALGTPYWTENPGQKLFQWDSQINFQYMPKDWITWWTELTFRHSDVPYWTGEGGITPPGSVDGIQAGTVPGGIASNGSGGTWYPDLRSREVVWGAGVMVKF
jgi:Putative beta-barrel porin-2, OmpL-like. bbp2/Carboxypeptidase regulatory-like domain